MKDIDICVGPRIHGNIAGILAGTPSVVLTHDSRTEELCEYHEIPHFSPHEVRGVRSLEDIQGRADYKSFNAGQAGRFERVVDFLHENGLSTIYDPGERGALRAYEQKLKEASFPAPIEVCWAGLPNLEIERLRWLRERDNALAKQVADLSREIATLQKSIDAASRAMSV